MLFRTYMPYTLVYMCYRLLLAEAIISQHMLHYACVCRCKGVL
jgi:hypothetical protein